MRWFVLAVVLLVCLLLAVLLAGAMLPVKHQVTGSILVHQSPESLWMLIADPEQQPKWRSQVVGVEQLPDRSGHPVWRERYKNGQKLSFETMVGDAPKLLVRRIVDEKAFGGEWQIELLPKEDGTEVRVTERGEVYNVLFRFVSRVIIGHNSTVKEYLTDLLRASGEKGQPVFWTAGS